MVIDIIKACVDIHKPEEALRKDLCRVFTSLVRVMHAAEVLSPQSEPHWLGCSSPFKRAAIGRRAAIILSRMFANVQMWTIIRKEEGDW